MLAINQYTFQALTRFFAEQLESDIAGEKEQLEEAKEGIEALRKDLEQLTNDIAASEVSQNVAERIYGM